MDLHNKLPWHYQVAWEQDRETLARLNNGGNNAVILSVGQCLSSGHAGVSFAKHIWYFQAASFFCFPSASAAGATSTGLLCHHHQPPPLLSSSARDPTQKVTESNPCAVLSRARASPTSHQHNRF